MKISTKGRYGLRILLDIALYRIGNKPRMIREIANNQEISEKYISRLITTYGENIGVMAITGVYSVHVIAGAAVLSIICSFVGPLSALIQTIPGPVIGGISFLLYGMIGTSGLRILVDQKVDYATNKNLILTSVVFVTGLSSITLSFGGVELTGMVLACIVAMILSLTFYLLDKFNLTNDTAEENN